MTSQLVTKGKATWVGSGAPNRSRVEPRKLKVESGAAYGFDKSPTPVPYGDTVGLAKRRYWIAADFVGTVTLKLRRIATRPDWGDLTWDNKPGVTGSSQPTVTLTNPTKGTLVEFSVATHLQTVANGGGKEPHYGWRIESDSATPIYLWGFDSDFPPELYVEFSNKPATPTDLTSGKVAVAKPVLSYTAPDLTGEDDITAQRIQIDTASDGVSPDFDSGWLTTLAPQIDLADTAYTGITGPTFWRVQWKNSSSVESGWSDWYQIELLARRVITITNPNVAGLVTDMTPELIATVDGAITHYRIQVVDPADPKTVIATSGKKAATGTAISWTVPKKKLHDDGSYRARFDVWDDEDRVETADQPVYTRATRNFVTDDVPGVTAPTLVSVTQAADLPVMDVEFTIPETPDYFIVARDGKQVDAQIEPVDVLVSGTTYRWREAAPSPLSSHTYKVRAVVNGEMSAWSNTITATVEPDGLWLISVERGLSVQLAEDNIDDWQVEDQVALYTVHGRPAPVQIRAALGTLGGTFTGLLREREGRTVASMRADLKAIRKLRESVTLIAADYSGQVWLRNVTDAVHRLSFPGDVKRRVSFAFFEDDE